MNKISFCFTISILFLVCFSSCQFFPKEDAIVLEEELKSGVEGVQKTYRKDKSLLTAIEHKDGKRHGISRSYFKDGKTIQYEICYDSGIRSGVTNAYYSNGQLFFTVNYIEGKREGISKKYYKTGELMAQIPYKGNKAQPGLIEYQKSGVKKTIYPDIVIEEIDKSASESLFIVRVRLSKPTKNVKYFRINDSSSDEIEETRLIDQKGVVDFKYFVRGLSSIHETIKIKAEYNTFLGNPFVIYKEHTVNFTW